MTVRTAGSRKTTPLHAEISCHSLPFFPEKNSALPLTGRVTVREILLRFYNRPLTKLPLKLDGTLHNLFTVGIVDRCKN
jgi:hypothetical protein